MCIQLNHAVRRVFIISAGIYGVLVAAAVTGYANSGVPWPATDALGRRLPMAAEVGPPRKNRFVGIFYFLTHGRNGDRGPSDISKILTQDPEAITNPADPLWGPVYADHYWGEPLFGYYVSDDESVLRKHAQMLSDAGVDVVIFDVSNQLTYPESWRALCRVFEEIRQAGGSTPQIAFLCPFGDPGKVVQTLWAQIYSKGLYANLWFRWRGKPLILADPDLVGGTEKSGECKTPFLLPAGHSLGQSFVANRMFSAVAAPMPTWSSKDSAVTLTLQRDGSRGSRLASHQFVNVPDNSLVKLELPRPLPPGKYYLEAAASKGTIGWWGDSTNVGTDGEAFADGLPTAGELCLTVFPEQANGPCGFFTFRKPQPDYFSGPTGPNQWGWLEVYPQRVFTNAAGIKEEIPVGVAENVVDGRLGCMSNPLAHGRSFHDGSEPPGNERHFIGRNFEEQWQRALNVDPEFVFITGWNEWTAMRFDINAPFYKSAPVNFVDEFDEEFSRDIEPESDGHGDAYYYQMIANIRRYKGVQTIPPVRPKPISINGQFDDWAAVGPEFTDTPDDPVHRSSLGCGRGTYYDNQTGRNDIIAAKVSLDQSNVYFYVRTQAPLTPCTGSNWMLLFIDADQNPKTGWLGYDFVVNRSDVRERTTTIERNLGGYRWGKPETIFYRTRRNELELAVPRVTLGLNKLPATLDFKWADNNPQTGSASDFTLYGDVAPNDRFNYRARFQVLDVLKR